MLDTAHKSILTPLIQHNNANAFTRTRLKVLFAVLLVFFSIHAFAFDHSYNVSGTDENGNTLEGTIYSTNGDQYVSGDLTDDNGNIIDFEGQWNGYGNITGETSNGVSVDLSTD